MYSAIVEKIMIPSIQYTNKYIYDAIIQFPKISKLFKLLIKIPEKQKVPFLRRVYTSLRSLLHFKRSVADSIEETPLV